jgi:hypothetical protein
MQIESWSDLFLHMVACMSNTSGFQLASAGEIDNLIRNGLGTWSQETFSIFGHSWYSVVQIQCEQSGLLERRKRA